MWKFIFNKFSLYVVIAVLGFSVWQAYSQATKYQQKATALESTISDLNQEIEYTKIQLNDSISVYQAEVKTLNITKNNLQAKYDKLLSSSKLKSKDVSNVTEITTVVHSVDTVVAVVDTFGGIKAKLEDAFIDIDVEVLPSKDTIIEYEVRDSLTLFNIQKQHSWLFGLIKWKEHKGLRVINHNPKANIVSLQTIDILE